jgi:hypothetical protein
MIDKFDIAFAMMFNPGASASAYDGTQKGNAAARRERIRRQTRQPTSQAHRPLRSHSDEQH